MVAARGNVPSGRELLHRVSLLLASDLPVRELVEKFAAMLAAATAATSVAIALEHDGHPYLSVGHAGGEHALDVPVFAGALRLGSLFVECPPDTTADDQLITIIEASAVALGARVQHELQRQERDRLVQIATTDALTGLANRRHFDDMLAREASRCARSGSHLSVLLLDVDFFKVYNDTYGHVAGDGCLQRIAAAIASAVGRPGDIACRYGGEEFAVILPETPPVDAARIAEAICNAVRGEQIAHQGSSLGYATVSVGCAGLVPQAGVDPAMLTEAADKQLYRAKEHGRNRVATAECVSDAPVVERQTGPKNNLPAPQNLFFGRDGDLDVMAAVARGSRVLTVAGPGGIGKTRLAIEFARRNAAQFRDGVFFIDLSTLSDGSFVAPAILSALGAVEQPGSDAEATLAQRLRDSHTLVVLDNCEHLLDRVALLLESLLAQAPGPHFVATSRRALRIDGENVYRVATLQQGDAVALFASRAQAVMPSFSVNAENLDTVKAICQQLNGIPLAIELAAARVRVMRVEQLESELTERAQRRTVDDTIEWSYGILSAHEKLLMRRLSVFSGRFTLELAQAICVFDNDEFDTIDTLGRLIDKSLLQSDPIEGRYWLLESTREFARRMLDQCGEGQSVRERHLEHLRLRAQAAEKRFGAGAGDNVRGDVAATYADLRAAMEWGLSGGGNVAAASALVAALGWYWSEGGLWREGRYWLELALRHSVESIGVELAARLYLASAVGYYVQGDFARMESEAQRCYDAYAQFDDRTGMASAQNLMAIAAQFSGRLQQAHDLWQAVLAASKDVKNIRMEAVVLGNLAELLTDWKAEYAESERLYERAANIHRQLTNSFPLGVTLGDWSATAAHQGDLRRAERLASEALEIFRGFDEEMRVVEQLIRIAHYRILAGRYDEARRTLREIVEVLPRCENPLYVVRAAEACVEFAHGTGRLAQAKELLIFADAQRAAHALLRPDALEARLQPVRDGAGTQCGVPSREEVFNAIRAL